MRLAAVSERSSRRDLAMAPPICSPMKLTSATSSGECACARAMMHVDDADQIAAAHQRHGEEGVEGIFRQRLERLETGVGGSLARKRHDGFVLRHPAGDAFAHLQANVADFRCVRKLRGLQYHFVGGAVHQIHQACIAARGFHGERDQFLEHLFQAQVGADNAADMVQERYLGGSLGNGYR